MSWNPDASEALYNVPAWGGGLFAINAAGNVQVSPDGRDGPSVDLFDLIGQIRRRGVAAPLLLRFDGLLRARVRQLNAAFNNARREFNYNAPYRGVYPIKVNQERHVVEALLAEGRVYGTGLEVGSKPELIAAIAVQAGEGSLMICNGYKDQEYVEMALLATQLGITPVLVIEKFTELRTILEASQRLGMLPTLGVRSKLSVKGSGRWRDSVGDRSKFGLSTGEIVRVVETLREHDMLGCLKLMHFHLGSQITQIRTVKQAMRESTNLFVGLSKMGVEIEWFDAGGGLGVDYDGSSTNDDSSTNYSLQEYANDIVWGLTECCREHGLKQPVIVTESGRALVAHHAVLVGEVVGVSTLNGAMSPPAATEDEPDVVRDLAILDRELNAQDYMEAFHDAQELREKAVLLFETGLLELPARARVEAFYWRACHHVLQVARSLDFVHEDLVDLERDLADTYFINVSVFQSLPDSWAIGQLFPVLPIHRHHEEPSRRAVIADLTCDSDGKICRFIDPQGSKETLELHAPIAGEPYYIGFFLVGAYQEILGDMHNLFGDTNVVHVDFDDRGKARLAHVLRGDRVKEVLSYVEYFEEDLLRSLRAHVEDALEAGRMSYEESALFWQRYEAGLHGYTYLTGSNQPSPKAQPTTPIA
jgi:arginine decarboxylase